jgi:hypothetical protein
LGLHPYNYIFNTILPYLRPLFALPLNLFLDLPLQCQNQCWVGITNTPKHHPCIPIRSPWGITHGDTLTKNQTIDYHLCDNQFLKNKNKILKLGKV